MVSAGLRTARAAGVGVTGSPAARSRWSGGGRPRLAAFLLFWVLPAVAFTTSTAVGHPPFVADDVLQNYPLRVLVGQLLHHGVLPLWNPYIWGGTPLLAGSNAGAAYPGTLLFAVLPATWAWTVNVVAVFGVAGIGMHRLLRDRGLGSVAALCGALAYTYGAFLTGQLEHLGLVQGASLLPWLMLAARRLDRPAWVATFGGLLALVVLTGEPRAATIAAVVVAAAVAEALLGRDTRRGRYLLGATAAAVLGALLSAVYWLPALAAAAGSQRAHTGFGFFSSGSLEPTWLLLFLVPYLMGSASQLWHQYFGPYNLAEISGYTGLFALIATGSLLPRVLRRREGWRRLVIWYVLLVAGLLLALGGNTPLGHTLARVPVYGGLRLQSRNVGLASFALAGLLAYWLDDLLSASQQVARGPARQRLWYALPGAATLLVVGVGLAAPRLAGRLLQASSDPFRSNWPYFLVTVLLAGGVGWTAWAARRWPARTRRRVVVGLLLVDIGLSAAGRPWSGPSDAEVSGATPQARTLATLVGPAGRFAVYDPWVTYSHDLQLLGAPDVNVLRGLASVQGYGSVVSASYDSATGAHQQDSLSPAALAQGTFGPLGLTVLLAPSAAFVVPAGRAETAPPQPGPAPLALPSGGQGARYLGPPREVDRVLLSVPGVSRAGVSVGLQTESGTWVFHPVRLVDGLAEAEFAGAAPAVAVAVRSDRSGPLTVAAIDVESGGAALGVDGPLVGALSPGSWRYAGLVGPYAAYRNLRAGPAWSLSGPGGRILQVHARGAAGVHPWLAPRVTVTSPQGALLVRAETYARGWVALARSSTGQITLPVERHGLIQAVRLPAGTWTVTFSYRPARVQQGAWLSLAGLLALISLAAGIPLARRWRR